MGKHGLGQRNDNGRRLMELCCERNFVVGGTLFPHKESHKATWVSPSGKVHNQIDHVIINSKWRSSLLDVRVKRGADINSDHHLVVGSVRLKVAAPRRSALQAKSRFDTCKLKKDSVKNGFINVFQQSVSKRC